MNSHNVTKNENGKTTNVGIPNKSALIGMKSHEKMMSKGYA